VQGLEVPAGLEVMLVLDTYDFVNEPRFQDTSYAGETRGVEHIVVEERRARLTPRNGQA